MSKRLEQIKQIAESNANELSSPYQAFILGAHWADYHPVNQWHKAENEWPAMDVREAYKGHLISYKVIVTDGKDMYMGRFDLLNNVWLVPTKEDIVVSHWAYLPKLPETEDKS